MAKKNGFVYGFLIFACALLWIIMMGSKNVYIAEIEEIMSVFNVGSKDTAFFGMTLYFITYAAVQIILFFCMGKINIKWYLSVTIVLSGVVTVIIAFATGVGQLWWLLAINGVLQAGVWGMCIAVIDKYLPERLKPIAHTVMNIGTAVAGVITYGSSAIFVAIKRWDLPFIVLGIILAVTGVIFFLAVWLASRVEQEITFTEMKTQTVNTEKPLIALDTKSKRIWFYVISFGFSLLVHCLLYGVMNWMPSLVERVYSQPRSFAILITVIAPIVISVGPIIAVWHCEKQKNFIGVSLLYLSIALIFAILLIFLYSVNLVLAMILLVLFLVVVQGAVTIIFSVVSFKMGEYVNTGAHSGLMNAAGALSAGFAPTITGALIDIHGPNTGWQLNYIAVACFTALIVVLVAVTFVLLRKSFKK